MNKYDMYNDRFKIAMISEAIQEISFSENGTILYDFDRFEDTLEVLILDTKTGIDHSVNLSHFTNDEDAIRKTIEDILESEQNK